MRVIHIENGTFGHNYPFLCAVYMYRNTIGKCKEKDNGRIGYPKSQAWILKVLPCSSNGVCVCKRHFNQFCHIEIGVIRVFIGCVSIQTALKCIRINFSLWLG